MSSSKCTGIHGSPGQGGAVIFYESSVVCFYYKKTRIRKCITDISGESMEKKNMSSKHVYSWGQDFSSKVLAYNNIRNKLFPNHLPLMRKDFHHNKIHDDLGRQTLPVWCQTFQSIPPWEPMTRLTKSWVNQWLSDLLGSWKICQSYFIKPINPTKYSRSKKISGVFTSKKSGQKISTSFSRCLYTHCIVATERNRAVNRIWNQILEEYRPCSL